MTFLDQRGDLVYPAAHRFVARRASLLVEEGRRDELAPHRPAVDDDGLAPELTCEQMLDPFVGRARRHPTRAVLIKLLIDVSEGLLKEIVSVLEVVVDERAGDPDLRRNCLDARLRDPLSPDDATG